MNADDGLHFIANKLLRNKAEAAFAERKGKDNFVEYEFVDYKGSCRALPSGTVSQPNLHPTGTVHGFAARPNLSLPVIKEAFEKVTSQTVQWFKKTL